MLIEGDGSDSVDISGLTAKQQRFVNEYVKDHHAGRACVRAGFSPSAASQYASKLLDNPTIQAAIKEAQDGQLARIGVSAERVMSELASIAFADVGDTCDWDGENLTIKSFASMKRRARRAIKSITITPGKDGNTVKLEMHDKMKAIDKLVKCLGLEQAMTAKLEVAGVSLPENTSIAELLALAAHAKGGR
jgi:phage terminase small subunit